MPLISTEKYTKKLTLFKNRRTRKWEMEPPAEADKVLRDDRVKYPYIIYITGGQVTPAHNYPLVLQTKTSNPGIDNHDCYLYEWPVSPLDYESVIEALRGCELHLETVLEEPITIPTNRGAFRFSNRFDLFVEEE